MPKKTLADLTDLRGQRISPLLLARLDTLRVLLQELFDGFSQGLGLLRAQSGSDGHPIQILLENLLRTEDGVSVTRADVEALASWDAKAEPDKEIAFTPARVILQDFTGVPAIVDLAAMRDAMARLGGDPSRINPLQPVELVVDHSVQVDAFGSMDAFRINEELDYSRNLERYAFLKWGQKAFRNFKVVPPNTGIVHQVNLEYLARVVFTSDENVAALREVREPGEVELVVNELTPESRSALSDRYALMTICTPLEAFSRELVSLMLNAAGGTREGLPGKRFLEPNLYLPQSILF
jgi:hypothetical protein